VPAQHDSVRQSAEEFLGRAFKTDFTHAYFPVEGFSGEFPAFSGRFPGRIDYRDIDIAAFRVLSSSVRAEKDDGGRTVIVRDPIHQAGFEERA